MGYRVNEIHVELLASCPPDSSWFTLRDHVRSEQRFMTRSWFTAWASAYLPIDRWIGPMQWLVARDRAGNILAIIPLARQRWPGFTVTSLGGYYWPFRAIPIVSDEERLQDTCNAIA